MNDSMRPRAAITVPLLLLAVLALAVGTSDAVPISFNRTVSNVDWTSGGCAGVGAPGHCTVTIAGVSGPVSSAYLYWHGIDTSGPTAVYDNQTVSINGHAVTGVALGDATTNCWGAGSSRAFEADVTAYVAGNGAYTIAGMSAGTGHSGNGASIVVIFNDGNAANNRDLVFFTGNDSNMIEGFPGEDSGWHASLPGINYGGGPVAAELHGADGQNAGDNSLTFSTVNGNVVYADNVTLWDGISLPSAGNGRNGHGLWDAHVYDITPAFGAVAGPVTLDVNGQMPYSDCLGLVLMLLDLEPFSAPGGCPDDIDAASQGYWHRQCLGMAAADPTCPGIDPGRNGRGPQDPTEPDFCPDQHDCAGLRLEDLGFYNTTTCEGMDADPPSDKCEKALKQLTAVLLNSCSGRIGDGCEVDLSALGCSATTVGEAVQEIADLIHMGYCNQAAACAAAINEGDAFPAAATGDGGGGQAAPVRESVEPVPVETESDGGVVDSPRPARKKRPFRR